jgi:hypothetical protein
VIRQQIRVGHVGDAVPLRADREPERLPSRGTGPPARPASCPCSSRCRRHVRSPCARGARAGHAADAAEADRPPRARQARLRPPLRQAMPASPSYLRQMHAHHEARSRSAACSRRLVSDKAVGGGHPSFSRPCSPRLPRPISPCGAPNPPATSQRHDGYDRRLGPSVELVTCVGNTISGGLGGGAAAGAPRVASWGAVRAVVLSWRERRSLPNLVTLCISREFSACEFASRVGARQSGSRRTRPVRLRKPSSS